MEADRCVKLVSINPFKKQMCGRQVYQGDMCFECSSHVNVAKAILEYRRRKYIKKRFFQ